MQLLAARFASEFEVSADLDMQMSEGFLASIDRLEHLGDNPALLEKLLRQATVETLLAAYRRRFLVAMNAMVNMQRDNRVGRTLKPVGQTLRKQMLAHYAKLDAAELSGDAAAAHEARQAILDARAEISDQLIPKRQARHGSLPKQSPGFRELAFRVLNMIGDSAAMQSTIGTSTQVANGFTSTGATITLGIGNRAALDEVYTPSATMSLSGHPTTSPNKILWRQLEFGTGVYSTDKASQRPRHRLPSGGWWYGRREGEALHLKGTRPGAMLQDPARHLPYEVESERFFSTFARLLTQALSGR